jgi:hypothetical protein
MIDISIFDHPPDHGSHPKYLLVDPEITVHLKTIKDLWACLVYVACKQTGSQRLKTVELLLIILKGFLQPTGDTKDSGSRWVGLPTEVVLENKKCEKL